MEGKEHSNSLEDPEGLFQPKLLYDSMIIMSGSHGGF